MIVAGFGFRGEAAIASLRDALGGALAEADMCVDALAAPADKAPRLAVLAAELGVSVIPVESAALQAAGTATHSPASLAARGTGSVCEAAALAAAGPGARLLTSRHIAFDRMATCALALGVST